MSEETSCGDPECPGWAHFNVTELMNGDLLLDIQRCDACNKLSEDEALKAHDAQCKECRPATLEDSKLVVANDDPTLSSFRIPFAKIKPMPKKPEKAPYRIFTTENRNSLVESLATAKRAAGEARVWGPTETFTEIDAIDKTLADARVLLERASAHYQNVMRLWVWRVR